jgi:hypothetical protein
MLGETKLEVLAVLVACLFTAELRLLEEEAVFS